MNTDQTMNLLMMLAGGLSILLALANRPGWWKIVGVLPEDGARIRWVFLAVGCVLVVDNCLTFAGIVSAESPLYLILYLLDGAAIAALILVYFRIHKNTPGEGKRKLPR